MAMGGLAAEKSGAYWRVEQYDFISPQSNTWMGVLQNGDGVGEIWQRMLRAPVFIWRRNWHWQEQRIQFKFSFHPKKYKETVLKQRADDLFGKSWYEQMLKDYNQQTYWLSANLKSFFKASNIRILVECSCWLWSRWYVWRL